MEDIDKKDLRVCNAMCCTYELLHCAFPQCLGCSAEYECLCFGHDSCFEPFDPNVQLIWCITRPEQCCRFGLGCCSCYMKSPKTCVRASQHCCCCLESVAFPCNETMPCVVAALGIMCYPTCGICLKFADVEKAGACGMCVPGEAKTAPGNDSSDKH